MHTKPHLLNVRARGLHCVYVSLVISLVLKGQGSYMAYSTGVMGKTVLSCAMISPMISTEFFFSEWNSRGRDSPAR